MAIRASVCLMLTIVAVGSASTVQGVDIRDTKMLTQPAISKDHIAFIYAEDLWLAGVDGKSVRRLTTDQGIESQPRFSPDGSHLAFSAQYDGNTDVYLVPVEGGVPERLTWHPGADVVQGFTADGKAVLFFSPRAVFTNRYTQLFTVATDGQSMPEPLGLPNAFSASYSADGSHLAYNPLYPAYLQWKNYRGGTVATVSIFRFSDKSVQRIPQPRGRCNDADPIWIGDKVYFRSDRNGEFNLFSFDPKSKDVKQLTRHADFPILTASAGDGKIIYEQAGTLHIFEPRRNRTSPLTVGVAADLRETRPRYVKGFRYMRGGSLSPSGARAALDFRGEIITVPAEKGDPRNLTNTAGAHERFPIWSPDGNSIAYFSDETGEYELYIKSQNGKGEAKKLELDGAGFYDTAAWSPDSGKIAYADNSWSLYWIDVKTGATKKIGSEPHYGPARPETIQHAWSPDSKWIAYTLSTEASIQTLYAYSLEEDKSYPITDGLSEVSEPVFDAGGKYLYFFASTNAGPVKHWFDMSNADMMITQGIYMAVLRKGVPSPLARESDEEKGEEEKKDAEKKDEEEEKDTETKGEEEFSIDFDGIRNRILALPVPAGDYSNLQAGAAGNIYYLSYEPGPAFARIFAAGEGGTLHGFDLKSRKASPILPGVSNYEISRNNKKLLYAGRNTMAIVPLAPKVEPGKGKLNIEEVQVRIDPHAEWEQIYDEAWRINRDYFYATNMHGADWNVMREKYRPFLSHLAVRSDLNRVIQWMCSELAVGHHGVGGGDRLDQPRRVPGGLLGADFAVENGRYRFKKIYGGLNWNPGLRSPLTEPGVDVQEGEYLLAVQGVDLRPPTNLYSLFENTASKIIELTVGPNPDGTNSRTVKVVPIANEGSLRNRDWVEGNLKKVEKATDGRVAYVYVPNTTVQGHEYFKRYFYPQSNKEAIIVDERFNGGGQVADYYINHLRRPFISYWATRYGADIKTPSAAIEGPKVMLIDETAGSGGDLLPWMFRKLELGTLIGKRTWGGLVGILGFPVLMDGGSVTAPNLAIWTEDGWVVENVGVPPDIEVEQNPADVMAGRDPQLEKAIEVVMDELRKNPPKRMERPPFPVRARKPN